MKKVTLSFKVCGSTIRNPGKVMVIQALEQGEDVFLTLNLETQNNNRRAVVNLDGERAGIITPASIVNTTDYDVLVELLHACVELEGKALNQTTTSYQVEIVVPKKAYQAAAKAAKAAAKVAAKTVEKRIINERICSKEQIDQLVFNYLKM